MTDSENKYADIIYLPHHISKKYPQMSMEDRAAQFSPFAALTGHDAAIQETARLTDTEIFLDEESLSALNAKFQILMEQRNAEVSVTYFEPDLLKSGGSYCTISGFLKKIDADLSRILLLDGTAISMEHVIDIESDIFSRGDFL